MECIGSANTEPLDRLTKLHFSFYDEVPVTQRESAISGTNGKARRQRSAIEKIKTSEAGQAFNCDVLTREERG
jgi:hypothetical protein